MSHNQEKKQRLPFEPYMAATTGAVEENEYLYLE